MVESERIRPNMRVSLISSKYEDDTIDDTICSLAPFVEKYESTSTVFITQSFSAFNASLTGCGSHLIT
jgi:hypothetical protein